MKITKLETITLQRHQTIHAGAISWLWVRVHTDTGLIGLGETYPAAEAAEAIIRNELAPVLLGRDAREIERLWADMFLAVSYHGWAGSELRAISAVDIALWDLLGKLTQQPVYQLLGGKSRERLRTYNTCYDHKYDFNEDAGLLAADLLASGITAMKIWQFDQTALANKGAYITNAELEKCLLPLRQIRAAVGDQMEVMMEFHGYWNLPCAVKIAKAVAPFNIAWLEEMLPQDNLSAYQRLKEETPIPLVLSERLMTRYQFREVIEQGIAQIVNPDLCWCGGLTEARKIASYADTHYIPVAPHNCGGPVLHFASMHLATSIPNLFTLESVRRNYLQEYQGIVTDTGVARNGWLSLSEAPGLGVELAAELWERPGIRVQSISL